MTLNSSLLRRYCETGCGKPFRTSGTTGTLPSDTQLKSKAVATRLAGAVFSRGDMEVFDQLIAEDDLVVFHDHVTATSKGEFLGVPPNGKPLQWTEIHFLRVRDGRIVEHWTNLDQFGILVELDAIPSP